MRLLAIGRAAGVFSAIFGVGGGIVAVPLLVAVANMPPRRATGTSLGAIGITALAGTLVFALRGEVQAEYAALVGIPGAIGALAGTALQQRLTMRTLTFGFALLLAAVGTWMVWP